VYFLRDPESWMPMAVPMDALAERYRLSGDGLVVLLPPERAGWRAPAHWQATESAALIDLERACVLGRREEAEAAAARIPDDSPAAARRDLQGRGVISTPKEGSERLLRTARDPEAHPLARLRALLALDSLELLDEVLDSMAGEESLLRPAGRRLLRLSRLRFEGRWTEIEALAEEMAARYPQLEIAWTYRAEALAQLGRAAEARACAEAALDLSPDSAHVRGFVRQLFPTLHTFSEDLAEVRGLIRRFPYNPHLKADLAGALASGPEGLEFEQALREMIRFFPRLPQGYLQLAAWYLFQERLDLARDCLAEGRNLIGEEELPRWGFEDGEDAGGGGAAYGASSTPAEGAAGGAGSFAAGDVGEARASRTDALDRDTLWAEAEREIFPERAGGQKPEGHTAFETLMRLRSQGQLPWAEEARLLAFHLHRVVAAAADEATAAEKVASRLPTTLRGPRVSALALVLESCEAGSLPRRVAVELLRWAEAQAGDSDRPAPLDFQIALLHELCGDSPAAEARYHELAEAHPGFSAPFFRLGMILAERGDLQASLAAHLRALEGDPGLDASREIVISIHRHLDDAEGELGSLEARCRRFPYHRAFLEDHLLRLQELRGSEAASEALERASSRFAPAIRGLFEVMLLLEEGRLDDAEAGLASLAAAEGDGGSGAWAGDEEQRGFATRVEVSLLTARGEWDRARRAVDRALEAEPEAAWLLATRARLLEEVDPGALPAFFRSVLEKGIFEPVFVAGFLGQLPGYHAPAAIELIEGLDPDQRYPAARAFSSAMLDQSTVDQQIELLSWCRDHLPRELDLRGLLARLLAWSGRHEEAMEVAQGLVDEDPESPRHMELMAFCLQDVDPGRALEFLEKEYALSRSLDTLLRTAMARHSLGDGEKAIPIYRQVLERSPGNELALVNLRLLGVPAEVLRDDLAEALRLGLGEETAELHLMALEAAEARREPLPEAWLEGARKRFEHLLELGEPCPERLRLGLALALCQDNLGDRRGARIYRRQAGPWLRRFWLRHRPRRPWPANRDWLPEASGGQRMGPKL
ncbi:MAG: tetratricopeptide repeat protein, partial [Holophagales bacterium]|nr:tetratricopeptide repeat protein [Holophagales bacterium]